MQKIAISNLSEPVRLFFSQLPKDEGILVEDEKGRACFGVIPYQEASTAQQAAALGRLGELQKRVGDRLAAEGKSEEDLDRILQDDE